MAGQRVLLADDVRNTGHTLKRCAELIRAAGGEVVATVVIIDRCEAEVSLGVPNISLITLNDHVGWPRSRGGKRGRQPAPRLRGSRGYVRNRV